MWLLALGIGCVMAAGQPIQERNRRDIAPLLSNLVGIIHAFPSEAPDSSLCIIGYRLGLSELLFVHRNGPGSGYVATYQVTIELRDSVGVVRLARVFQDSSVVATIPSRWSDAIATNMTVAKLAHGIYTMTVDVVQSQRQRMVWQTTIKLDGTPSAMAQASLTFVRTSSDDQSFCVEPWGGTIPFGTRRATMLVWVPRSWSGRDPIKSQCVLLRQYYPFFRGNDTVVAVPLVDESGQVFGLPSCTIHSSSDNNQVCIELIPKDQFRLLRFTMDFRRAIPGEYLVRLVRMATNDTLEIRFRVQWFNPPPHLFSSRYAVEVMYYVLTDDEYQALLSVPDTDRVAAIIAWWSKHDPTSATAYNEAMVEYFHRAFEARTKFATTNETDGALTERGKIFILFGEPTRVETDLEPGKPGTEVWYYTNAVRKRFTFEITREGRYRLTEVESL